MENKLFALDNVFLSPHIAGKFRKCQFNVISDIADAFN